MQYNSRASPTRAAYNTRMVLSRESQHAVRHRRDVSVDQVAVSIHRHTSDVAPSFPAEQREIDDRRRADYSPQQGMSGMNMAKLSLKKTPAKFTLMCTIFLVQQVLNNITAQWDALAVNFVLHNECETRA